MPSPPSTRPSGSRGRRSSAFVRERHAPIDARSRPALFGATTASPRLIAGATTEPLSVDRSVRALLGSRRRSSRLAASLRTSAIHTRARGSKGGSAPAVREFFGVGLGLGHDVAEYIRRVVICTPHPRINDGARDFEHGGPRREIERAACQCRPSKISSEKCEWCRREYAVLAIRDQREVRGFFILPSGGDSVEEAVRATRCHSEMSRGDLGAVERGTNGQFWPCGAGSGWEKSSPPQDRRKCR